MLRKAIQFGHRGVTARYLLAMVLLKLNRRRDAIRELKAAIQSEVRAPFLYQGLGIAYAVDGNFKRAIVAFKTALSLGSRSEQVIQNLAQAYLDANEAVAAKELLTARIESAPDNLRFRELLGSAYFSLQEFKSAIGQWIHVYAALERQKADLARLSRIANNIGASYISDGSVSQAETWLRRSLDLSKDAGPFAYENLAKINLSRSDNVEAIRILRECIRLFPGHTEARELFADACIALDMYGEGCDALLPILHGGKAPVGVYTRLGWFLQMVCVTMFVR